MQHDPKKISNDILKFKKYKLLSTYTLFAFDRKNLPWLIGHLNSDLPGQVVCSKSIATQTVLVGPSHSH